jgi:hypothetical protein
VTATKPPGDANAEGQKVLSISKRLPPSKPIAPKSPPGPIEAGLEHLGPWLVLKRDHTGKRAVARCSYCQMVREIGVADGCIARCGCSGWMRPGAERFAAPAAPAAPASTFADGIAGAERFGARGRHRGRT